MRLAGSRYYLLSGKETIEVTDVAEWAEAFMCQERHVAKTTLPNGRYISTVFLGLDHSFEGGPPILFETMVFPSTEDYDDLDCARCCTWEQAEEQHKEMVKKWTKIKQK